MEDANRCPATLDGTPICALSDEEVPNSVNIARRSISIFSRRGIMTPELTSLAFEEAADTPKHTSAKQRGWLLRRSSRQDAIAPKIGRFKSPRGTVLHAVPPAHMVRMSALEEEMAQSPNDEILSAISEHPPTPSGATTPPYHRALELQELKATSPSKATSRRDESSRIGVWVDGVVHWNERASAGGDLSQIRPSVSKLQGSRRKPLLSITIPTIHQPQPRRPLSLAMQISRSAIPLIDRPLAPLRRNSPVSRSSRSSTSSSSIGEERSICSNRSSTTSIEVSASILGVNSLTPMNMGPSLYMHKHACNAVDDLTTSDDPEEQNRIPLIPRCAAPCPPVIRDQPAYQISSAAPSIRLVRPRETTSGSLHRQDAGIASPTWSQAEHDLQHELSTGHDDNGSAGSSVATQGRSGGSLCRSDSVRTVMQPPNRAPTIPKRSRKREWVTHIAYPASELQRRQSESRQKVFVLTHDDGFPRKSVSVSCSANPVTATLGSREPAPPPPERPTRRPFSNLNASSSHGSDVNPVLAVSRRNAIAVAMMPTASAEDVLLHILARLHSPRNLFHTAIINKGMYRIFQENDIHLLRTVVFNESPALWELLEWRPSRGGEVKANDPHVHVEHSPVSYIRCYRREKTTIEGLKRSILETCQTFLRRETVNALSILTHSHTQRFDDALWRIWTFCQIFGSGKNREDDITGQMDWLRGGVLANNEDCIASTEPNMDFDLSSVLISPPACFAESNREGLSAGQLFDMTEMWTCMTALLQSYHGRVGQARYYGIFDQCEVEEGDVEHEAAILEEWTAYLLTLGPRVVLEMAQLYPAAGFALARDNGWTRWTPPTHNGSRSSFLKEPVAKSYEEQVTMVKERQRDPREQVRKDASRRRVATLAAEIRFRRQSSAYKRSPLIDMTTERAMSMSSRMDSVSPRSDYHSQESSRHISSAPVRSSIDPRMSHAVLTDRMETLGRRGVVESAENTGERAIRQLVTMGFERELVVDALRITDRGDGLYPDRAIDLLLRQQE